MNKYIKQLLKEIIWNQVIYFHRIHFLAGRRILVFWNRKVMVGSVKMKSGDFIFLIRINDFSTVFGMRPFLWIIFDHFFCHMAQGSLRYRNTRQPVWADEAGLTPVPPVVEVGPPVVPDSAAPLEEDSGHQHWCSQMSACRLALCFSFQIHRSNWFNCHRHGRANQISYDHRMWIKSKNTPWR